MLPGKLRFGAFVSPFHPLDENPTAALERDLRLAQIMDSLGFDEIWFGEHHSGGVEISASPEIVIAIAAERTKSIRLGTGVASLPYHHPLILADRINQLDHLTRGRVMLGVGPGALVTDAHMMGIPVGELRDRMDEALGCVVPLLQGETVTHKGSWFELIDARLQLTPFSRPSIEIVTASQVSPTGATAAGRFGLGLLSIGATSTGGFNALASNWAIAEQSARDHGNTVDRAAWRLVGPVHIAPTREQAKADVRYGLGKWLHYANSVGLLPVGVATEADPVEAMIASGLVVFGTPDDAIAQIERLQKQSGGFGCFLTMDHNWADWGAKMLSYEFMARHVFPRFQSSNINREASFEYGRVNRPKFAGEWVSAIESRIKRHIDKNGAENIAPDVMATMNANKDRPDIK